MNYVNTALQLGSSLGGLQLGTTTNPALVVPGTVTATSVSVSGAAAAGTGSISQSLMATGSLTVAGGLAASTASAGTLRVTGAWATVTGDATAQASLLQVNKVGITAYRANAISAAANTTLLIGLTTLTSYGGGYNSTSGHYIPPVKGLYAITAKLRLDNNDTDNTILSILVNGAVVGGSFFIPPPTTGGAGRRDANATALLELTTSSTITFVNGITTTILNNQTSAGGGVNFSAVLITPT